MADVHHIHHDDSAAAAASMSMMVAVLVILAIAAVIALLAYNDMLFRASTIPTDQGSGINVEGTIGLPSDQSQGSTND